MASFSNRLAKMKLLVTTVIILLNIHYCYGDRGVILQLFQKVGSGGCDSSGSNCNEPCPPKFCKFEDEDGVIQEGLCSKDTIPPYIVPVGQQQCWEGYECYIREPEILYCDFILSTDCDDGSKCHENATCIPRPDGTYWCKCNTGYAGDGNDCGLDSDIDSWPDVDLECCIVNISCIADNCVDVPNSGQEDFDNDGFGDACSKRPPRVPKSPFCTPRGNCKASNDTDGDGHVDSCDNCPHVSNVDQADFDGDRVGDVCDTDEDTDGDGIEDGIDNCKDVCNQGQSDVDCDGIGDACDDDADNDGILNPDDNCWLTPNPAQEDVCQNDLDGDGAPDNKDICPKDPAISSIDFTDFNSVLLDNSTDDDPIFLSNPAGTELTQTVNSRPGLMFGVHTIGGVDFDGTFFVAAKGKDDDYAGFVFGYKSALSFYVVMWKKKGQNYWDCNRQMAKTGLQLKKVRSNTGPLDNCLADALWSSSNTTDQVSVLWHDSNIIGWDHDIAYRWELIHRPHIGLIRFRFLTAAGVIADSGNIYDVQGGCNSGGYLGVYCHSQAAVTFANLQYKCDDDTVPQEVYDDLPSELQANVTVDPSKFWSGKVKAKRGKPKMIITNYEPGMGFITPPPTDN